jgi:hypothetical protein
MLFFLLLLTAINEFNALKTNQPTQKKNKALNF